MIPTVEELRKQNFSQLLDENFVKNLSSQKSNYRLSKRIIEVPVAAILLIFFSQLWLMIAFLVGLDSKGNALFAHKRVGQSGKLFTVYKFRTMRFETQEQAFAPENSKDPRVTKFGKFLRRTSLDEIPQLWNVIKGDMAFIGPRPEMPFIVENYTNIQRARLLVKPGLTGLWQIKGRKDLPLHENVEFDLYYIMNESPLLDLLILLKTFSVVLNGKGAY